MVLPLLSPIGPNFIKDFPGLNAVNCDLIDPYAGPCLTSDSMQTYSPTLKASVTDPVLGTTGAINKGYFYQIFDQVFCWGEFRFGTGFSAGSGIYRITLPFPVQTNMPLISDSPGIAPIIGNGSLRGFAANATKLPVSVHISASFPGSIFFGLRMGSGLSLRELREANYFTWAATEGVSWMVRYKRQP